MRDIPLDAVDLCVKWEGFRRVAYLCPAGVPTIGYGHTNNVNLGDTTTKEQARIWLREDLRDAQRKLYAVLKSDVIDELTENQWAALLSFVFNLGAKKTWTIWKRINARQFDQVPGQMILFVNAGGKKVQGLVNRRTDEIRLWSTEEPGSTEEHVPSSTTRLENTTPPTSSDPTPAVQSKTLWTGGIVTAAGAVQGAQQIQAIAAPQAQNNEWVAQIASIAAFVVVAGGIAILVFRWLDKRRAQKNG
jgi:lysozyme